MKQDKTFKELTIKEALAMYNIEDEDGQIARAMEMYGNSTRIAKEEQPKEEAIYPGMKIYHKNIRQWLVVAPDEDGPAYTGNEFKENEIALCYAETELKNGNASLTGPEEAAISVQGGHTAGKLTFTKHNYGQYYGDIEADLGDRKIRTVAVLLRYGSDEEMQPYAEKIINSYNEYDGLKAENEKVKRLLHDLTPGGSEFYNDPEYCARWIRKATEENHYTLSNIIKKEKSENTRLLERNRKLEEALEKVVKWEMPGTGMFWDKEEKEPMSYSAAYGSNGERDYIKSIAATALNNNKP